MRASSVQYPERLREGDDTQEDAAAVDGRPAQYMNQSVFSMIAAAGSKADFHSRFDEGSSESDEEQGTSKPCHSVNDLDSTTSPSSRYNGVHEEPIRRASSGKHKKKAEESKGFHALPKLNLRAINEKHDSSHNHTLPLPGDCSTSQSSPDKVTPRDAPLMSKMLEAQGAMSPSDLLSEKGKQDVADSEGADIETSPTTLVLRLKEIFGFEKAEEVIAGESIYDEVSYWVAD